MKNALRILLVDDSSNHITISKAQLINLIEEGLNLKERGVLAEEYFEILEFEIVGEAIDKIKSGFSPDLAILDIDFSGLDDKTILKKGYIPKIEKTKTRGFDLLEYLSGSVNIFYTGQDDDIEIMGELDARNQTFKTNWYAKGKGDKGSFGMIFNSSMPFILKKAAYKLVSKLSKRQKTEIQKLIDGFNSNENLLEYNFDFNDRKIQGKKLLIGWAKIVRQGDKINAIYTDPADSLEELLNESEKYSKQVIYKGVFLKEYVQVELESILKNKEEKSIIDKHSAQFLLEAYSQFKFLQKVEIDKLFFTIDVKDHNCEKESSFNREKLIKALICRRVFIGLCLLRDEKILSEKSIVSCAVRSLKGTTSPESLRRYMRLLGLTGETGRNPELIKYNYPYIMKEEEEWLEVYVNEIKSKIQRDDFSPF